MNINAQLEALYRASANKPRSKDDDTITTFNRDVYWYDRDEVQRQQRAKANTGTSKVTYETHRKVVETAVNMMRKSTQHEIALCILTHRYFAEYRKNIFEGAGNFNTDYNYILLKVGSLFDAHNSKIYKSNIASKLAEFNTPTLVAVNHIVGTVEVVTVVSNKFTLNEWATKYNANAPESTTYMVAGLKVGM